MNVKLIVILASFLKLVLLSDIVVFIASFNSLSNDIYVFLSDVKTTKEGKKEAPK